MKRFHDEPGDDPLLREAARLTRAAVPEELTAEDRARLWRSQVRLRPRPSRVLGLRPSFAIGLLLFAAFASASIWYGVRRAPPPSTPSVPLPPPRSGGDPPASRSSEMPILSDVPTDEALVVEAPAEAHRPPGTRRTAPPSSVEGSAASTAATADAALLLEHAVRALRHEGDAARAARLADEFLSRFPKDELTDEGLAISISAHHRLGDGQAPGLAERYLKRFPRGPFRIEAQSIRDAE